ncbi:velvet factor-domain-containing protein [Lentinula aciculospora]|uniref:Velvet factor-domain-containing protein n=1 Tax=Lentinula aciculospora TaxID=153920 RepID=A0A9W9A022_9AGAR|nr:velvet factor-domain-containing protein [Lentinula aciculospora]
MDNHLYATGNSLKDQAIYFGAGQWKGRVLRIELRELQHADLGRKYAEVDRRPLDPPPVVALRLFERIGMDQESEISSHETIETIGLLCAVELIPVLEFGGGQHPTCDMNNSDSCANSPEYGSNHYMPIDVQDSSFVKKSLVPASEIARLTENVLVGSKIIQPHLIGLNGQKKLLFVFSDLSVRSLGLFRLRYKFCDLFSILPGDTDTMIQAECIGGMFRVFSTKDFPGLQLSTTLTKILSAQGVSLNIRNSARRPKKAKKQNDHGYQTKQEPEEFEEIQ